MNPIQLYEMVREEFATEGIDTDTWDELKPREMIAWGKVCRRLQREHGLEK